MTVACRRSIGSCSTRPTCVWLTLNASTTAGGSGDIRLADGSLAVNGAASLVLNADNALALAGRDGRLVTAGNLHVSARGIVAEAPAAGQVIQADGTLTTASRSARSHPHRPWAPR